MARSTIPTRSSSTRVETGCFGSVELAADHGGPQTERARQNFRVGRDRMPLSIIDALGIVKLATEANRALGSRDQCRDRAIVRAARKVIDGNLDEQLPLVVWHTHTQTDLNLNGVIGNRANALLGGELGSKSSVQQDDRVDMRRPLNDSFPTATHVAAVRHIVSDLVAASEVHRALRGKEKAFAKIVKIGHAPSDYAARLESGTKRLELAATELMRPENQPDCAILPLLTYGMMHSIQLLADSARSFAEHCVNGTLRELMQRSLLMVTTRAPKIGCDNAAKMTQLTRARGTTLKEDAVALGFLTGSDFNRHVQPTKMKRAR